MEDRTTDFSAYTLEDFIDHPGFVLWVTAPDDQLNIFWQQVQDKHPGIRPVIEEARRHILTLRFKTEHMEVTEQQLLWQAIETQAKLRQKPVVRFQFWLRTSAAVLLAGLLLSLFLYTRQQKIMVTTSYGQIKTVVLPDGSAVTLNANSVLHYPKNWSNTDIREVWIAGEGFFKVNHLHQSGEVKAAERFIVHANDLNVEVLGTTFNVNNRRNTVKVALVTGSVSLKVKDLESAEVKLRPGELAVYLEKKQHIVKKQINAPDYVSWSKGELHFNNTPLTEVFAMIEDNYGYKAVLKDPAIGDRKLSGTFAFSSEDALFKAIATSLGISVRKDQANHQIIVQ